LSSVDSLLSVDLVSNLPTNFINKFCLHFLELFYLVGSWLMRKRVYTFSLFPGGSRRLFHKAFEGLICLFNSLDLFIFPFERLLVPIALDLYLLDLVVFFEVLLFGLKQFFHSLALEFFELVFIFL
jgi:hypothetical protein